MIVAILVTSGGGERRLAVRVGVVPYEDVLRGPVLVLVRPAVSLRLGGIQQPLPPDVREAIVAAMASSLVAALRPRQSTASGDR